MQIPYLHSLMLHQGVKLIGQWWLVYNQFYIFAGIFCIGWFSKHNLIRKCPDQRV